MPIDERLLTAEDVDLNFKIGKLGYKLLSVPDVKVFHRRRGSPRKLFIQFYRFAIGRLQVGKKDIRMINAIHILVGISLPVFILLIALYGINPFIFYLPIGVFAAGLFALFLFGLSKSRSLLVGLNLIAAALIGILGWSLGFMRELLFPLKDASNR